MKTQTIKLSLASMLVAASLYAQENQPAAPQQTATEQIRSGIGRILTPEESAAGAPKMSAEQAISSWKAKPKETAQKLISKYGQPNEVTSMRLIWHDNKPWKRTEVFNEEIQHDFPIAHTDFMEQTIAYRVPSDKFDELAKFDGSVYADRTRGELSARCDKEENNTLSLNLAQEVIKGSKSPEEAREAFTQTIEKSMQGEKPAMMQSLQFQVARAETADPDEVTLTDEAAGAEQKEKEKQEERK